MKKFKILFIISLSFNIVAGVFGVRRLYYMRLDAENVRPTNFYSNLKIKMYSSLPINSNDIVFIGDSEIEFFNTQELLQGYSIKNRGIGGDNTRNMSLRMNRIVAGKPRKIFIEIGTNDIYNKTPIDSSMKYMSKIISHLKTSSPETIIYVQSILPRNEFSVNSYNKSLQTVCKESGVIYINLYDSFSKNGSLNKQYDCGDGLHLNGQGYLLWSKLLKPYL